MGTIEICRVGTADAALLEQVADGVFNDPIKRDRLAAYLAFPASLLVIARDGSLVVGQAKGAINMHPDKPADLYLDELRVAPTHQRRGIARRMLAILEEWARDRGCADVWLATNADNQAAQSMYGSFAEPRACLLYYWDL